MESMEEIKRKTFQMTPLLNKLMNGSAMFLIVHIPYEIYTFVGQFPNYVAQVLLFWNVVTISLL